MYLIESSRPQIFSTGWGRGASIFVSVGLLETLTQDEVAAVVAHEIAHLMNNDSALKTVAEKLKYMLINPLGLFLEPAISREREFFADAEASRFVGGPGGLISAMTKLNPNAENGGEAPGIGTMMGHLELKSRLLRRHPPVSERILRLQALR